MVHLEAAFPSKRLSWLCLWFVSRRGFPELVQALICAGRPRPSAISRRTLTSGSRTVRFQVAAGPWALKAELAEAAAALKLDQGCEDADREEDDEWCENPGVRRGGKRE